MYDAVSKESLIIIFLFIYGFMTIAKNNKWDRHVLHLQTLIWVHLFLSFCVIYSYDALTSTLSTQYKINKMNVHVGVIIFIVLLSMYILHSLHTCWVVITLSYVNESWAYARDV